MVNSSIVLANALAFSAMVTSMDSCLISVRLSAPTAWKSTIQKMIAPTNLGARFVKRRGHNPGMKLVRNILNPFPMLSLLRELQTSFQTSISAIVRLGSHPHPHPSCHYLGPLLRNKGF